MSYLARAPRVPFCMLIFIGLEAKGRLASLSRGDVGSLPLYGGTFARSYSVLILLSRAIHSRPGSRGNLGLGVGIII